MGLAAKTDHKRMVMGGDCYNYALLASGHIDVVCEAGLKLPVNTDAHQVSALDWMDIGIAQARRAWLTKDHVLNTRTWKQLEKLKKR